MDVDDEARSLVPAQDLVLSWKGNTKVMARAGAGKDERDKGSCGSSEQGGGVTAGEDQHMGNPKDTHGTRQRDLKAHLVPPLP